MMTVKKTRSASEAVTMIWLVTVNVKGISPITLVTSTNMNSENTSGKNFSPCSPAVLRIVLAMNS